MPVIFKIDYPNADKPIAQEVEKIGFPNLDADGETQYENTHFADQTKAWNALIIELEATLSHDSKSVIRATQDLQKAKDRLSDTCILLENAKRGREDYFSTL